MKLLREELKGRRKGLILGPLFKLLESLLELCVPLVMADIIDTGIRQGDRGYILRGGAVLLLLAGLCIGAAMVCQYYAALVSGEVGRGLRVKLYAHAMGLSDLDCAAWGPEGLITRLTLDASQVQTAVNMFIRLAMRTPLITLGSIVMAMLISPAIGVIFLISTPLILLILYLIMRRTLPGYGEIQQAQDQLQRLSGEALEGVKVIRAFSRQPREEADFRAAGDRLTALLVRVGRISAALGPLTSIIINLAILAIVWLGARFVFSGALAAGQVIALVSYMNQTLLALVVAANLIVLFTRAGASARRLDELMALEPAVTAPLDFPAFDPAAPLFELRGVSFAYHPGADDVLEGISFSIPPGETVGLIGGTGSGKSTIAALLLRQFDPGEGRIFRSGVELRALPLSALRRSIGYVPQQAALFSGTLRRNLSIANPAASEEELWRALEIAQAAEFVTALPQGLDSPVEEDGKNFSGGQRQRLTIARALLRQPELLILDDAASALDYATDAALRRALARELRPGTSLLIISQRVSAVRSADRILVLDDGRLAGEGSHAALLDQCAVYREICASQGIAPEGRPQ